MRDSADMEISIIIPCHNAEAYIAQTIGSVLEQTRLPKEIIVIDDGSSDDSLAEARRVAATSQGRVKVYAEHSGNAPRTRNLGALLAEGDAYMFLDADDVLGPNALEALAEALATSPAAVAACPWKRLEQEGEAWVSRPATGPKRRADQDALAGWLTGWYYPPCALLWSKQAFDHIGGWDEEAVVNQDGDLMMRALACGIPLVETAAGVAYYRRLPTGQVSLSGKRMTYEGLVARIGILDKIARILEEQGRIEHYYSALASAFALIAADARGTYAGLQQEATERQRLYTPSALRRGVIRLQRSLARHKSTQADGREAAGQQAPEVVVSGLGHAEGVRPDITTAGETEALIPVAAIVRPAVSVVIPVYNRAHLLSRSLASVVNQTCQDFEVLVIDDCSRDDPAAVIRQFGDERIRYVRQPYNQGVAAARNRGLREARAPLVAFLDDDDEWFPEKLEAQIQLFEKAPKELGLVYTGVETVTDNGEVTEQVAAARGDLYRELLVKNLLHGGSSAMVRRNVITRVGFFDETLPAIEDYDYWLRISRYYKVDCIGRPLVRYHDLRDISTTQEASARRSRNIEANLRARELFYEKHKREMQAHGVAHLFLAQSARRHVSSEWHDAAGARRLALKAFIMAPQSRLTVAALGKAFVPREKLSSYRRLFSKN
ncbi:glycosyltransferase family 2 protein [Halomonas sp. E14]|uniref:glycosyltransferase family 2 protein n=1 Tax=Halomonas sp. E14 TaxID=3397245 RepID=UPI00403E93B3